MPHKPEIRINAGRKMHQTVKRLPHPLRHFRQQQIYFPIQAFFGTIADIHAVGLYNHADKSDPFAVVLQIKLLRMQAELQPTLQKAAQKNRCKYSGFYAFTKVKLRTFLPEFAKSKNFRLHVLPMQISVSALPEVTSKEAGSEYVHFRLCP